MKVAFDIGGVISKDRRWVVLMKALYLTENEIFIITDMHYDQNVHKLLINNGIHFIKKENIYSANYAKYGEMCKAILLKELKIDMFFDDFIGYLNWDSQLGPAPIRCLVMPNPFEPYWSPDWKCEGGDFGRRVAPENLLGDENETLD